MILGINKDPSVKTYAYQAYVTSILESKEYVRIKIKDANLTCIPETHHDESDVFRITITSGVSPTMA